MAAVEEPITHETTESEREQTLEEEKKELKRDKEKLLEEEEKELKTKLEQLETRLGELETKLDDPALQARHEEFREDKKAVNARIASVNASIASVNERLVILERLRERQQTVVGVCAESLSLPLVVVLTHLSLHRSCACRSSAGWCWCGSPQFVARCVAFLFAFGS